MAAQLVDGIYSARERVLYGRGQGGGLQIDRIEERLLLVEQIQQRVVGQSQTGRPSRPTPGLGKLIEGLGGGRVPLVVDYGAQVAVEKVVAVGLYCRGGCHIVALQFSPFAAATSLSADAALVSSLSPLLSPARPFGYEALASRGFYVRDLSCVEIEKENLQGG